MLILPALGPFAFHAPRTYELTADCLLVEASGGSGPIEVRLSVKFATERLCRLLPDFL